MASQLSGTAQNSDELDTGDISNNELEFGKQNSGVMKRIFLTALLLALMVCINAQQLKFNRKGEFKILQFTDVHYVLGTYKSDVAIKCINELVDAERPDLVVFTGDNVYSSPAAKSLQVVLDCISAKNVPFVMLFGNHDEQFDCTNAQLYDQIRTAKNNIQPDRNGLASPDYVLNIKSSDGSHTAANLYCLDSHSMAKMTGEEGYAWLTFEQVEWYRQQAKKLRDTNGGATVPALAFFHIPLREYNEAATNEDAILIGTRMEKACSPDLNTGMFMAMKESGDVMGVFVGHDHDNDYATMYHGILLAYGRYTGGNTEYNHLSNGGRVIILKEGQRSFNTYVHLRGGEILNHATYPTSFVKDDWKKRAE